MRHVADRMSVPPAAITEFAPPASAALLAQITAGIDQAEAHGWIELGHETLESTGRRIFMAFPASDEDSSLQGVHAF